MESFPFRPIAQGVRTLWVLNFKSQVSTFDNPRHPKLPVDLFIPSPFANEWLNTNTSGNQKAMEYLEEIQKACTEIKKEAKETDKFESLEDYLKKAKDLFKNLESLDDLMKNYNDFLKRYYSTPPEKENPENPEDQPGNPQ